MSTQQNSIPSRANKRRANTFDLQQVTCVEILTLEESVEKFDWEKLFAFLPLILSVFWILIGTVFYAVHDNLGWARALFMSVNVGWSIGWPMDGLSEFDSPMSKMFTIYHTSIGVLFAGVTVLYIAQEVGKNKDNWILQTIKMKELDATAETEGCWDSFEGLIKVHFPTLRIIAVFLVWFTFGLLWFPFTNTEYTVAKNVDFLLSTLTTGGYMALPSTIGAYQLIVTALYTNIGVPLLSIVLGLFMSLIMEAPEDNLIFHQIVAPVISEEISFMQEFEIENGDGTVDSKEFIILAVVRIGSVSPELIRRINERFRQLDRKRMGKILYDDLIVGRRKPHPAFSLDATSVSTVARPASVVTKAVNNSLFRARAKSVFNDSGATAAGIAANIAKIQNLGPPPANSTRRHLPPSSTRTTSAVHLEEEGGSKRESDSDSEGNGNGSVDVEDEVVGADERCCDIDTGNRMSKILSSSSSKYRCEEGEWVLEDFTAATDTTTTTHLAHLYQNEVDGSERVRHNSCVSETERNELSGASVTAPSPAVTAPAPSLSSYHHLQQQQQQCSPRSRKIYPSSSLSTATASFSTSSSSRSNMSSSSSSCLETDNDSKNFVQNIIKEEDEDIGNMISQFSAEEDEEDFYHPKREEEEEEEEGIEEGGAGTGTQQPYMTDSSKDKLKKVVKKQKQMNDRFASLANYVNNQKQEVRSKNHERLEKAKKQRRRSKREEYFHKKKGRLVKTLLVIKRKLKSSPAIACYVWFLWLAGGGIFYTFEENLTVCQGIYVSTSIGYGIFWYDQTSTEQYAKIFSTLHFSIGVFGVAFAMAVFARSIISRKEEWFSEAKQRRLMKAALITEGLWDDVETYFDYYWPKLRIHICFLLWVLLGIVWGVTSIKWSVLDAWLFSMTAMATGGLVSLPSSGVQDWDYVFVSLYIIIGAPLMAISCGISAHNISNFGHNRQIETKLHAPVTEDELVMMKHLGIEDNDGCIDSAEFTLLMLVRVGALNPDLIGVLFDRFYEIDSEGTGNVTYEELQNRKSFMGTSMQMPLSFLQSIAGSLRGSLGATGGGAQGEAGRDDDVSGSGSGSGEGSAVDKACVV